MKRQCCSRPQCPNGEFGHATTNYTTSVYSGGRRFHQCVTEAEVEAVEETLDDIAHLAQALTLFDEGELSHDELVRLFQHLVDTGLAWSLQGSIGRLAVDLIEAGLVKLPEVTR